MNQTVKRIVDLLFEDTVENEETKALHEELMNNCQEHYEDLIKRGLTEDEATGEVVDSLKGMKDVIDQYPKKSGWTQYEAGGNADGNRASGENGAPQAGTTAGIDRTFTGIANLQAETTDQEICVSPSGDGAIHVFCSDPEGATVEQEGNRLFLKGAKKREKFAAPFAMENGEEVTLSGLLNMVGKAIRNVAVSFANGAPIRIAVPDEGMESIELNSRSGDINCSCAFARNMTVRSTSGDVSLHPETEKTAMNLLVSTVSGEADVDGSAMTAEVSSMSGDVTVDGVFETLHVKSTSGDAKFTGSVAELRASSVSGDAEMTIENTSLKQIDARSTSGDVEIALPAGLTGVHAECSTVSGEVLSRVSDAGIDAPVQIRAKSVSGDVRVG